MLDVYWLVSVGVSANPRSSRVTIHMRQKNKQTKKRNIFQHCFVSISELAGVCCGLSPMEVLLLALGKGIQVQLL